MALKQIKLILLFLMFSQNLLSSSIPPRIYVLIINLYNETNMLRCQEYIYCLMRNLTHPRIDKIHVIYDTSKNDESNHLYRFLNYCNIDITYMNERASFSDIFDLANTRYPNANIIMSNADIYFDNTLSLLDICDLNTTFIGLTRWDVSNDYKEGTGPRICSGRIADFSQDTWVFRTPIKKFENAQYKIGTQHCEGYLAYEVDKAGYKLFNPCLSVKCHHLHVSELRNWELQPVSGPLKQIPWVSL